MKKIYLFLLLSLVTICTQAKLVKFSVNMQGQVIDTNGVHITGDFQLAAGFPADWDPATTLMTNTGADTNIYSVVVNIPAFRKYEYKIINGMFTYDVEFVPIPSRVDPILDDNRWIYIDSLDSDTMQFGAIRFSGNAPMGQYLLRCKVDMQLEAIVDTVDGVHVAGDWQSFNPATTRMYSFDGNVYQYHAYIDSTNATAVTKFKYANGNLVADYENIAGACDMGNNNRGLYVVHDTVLDIVCFSSCSACTPASVKESLTEGVMVFPNPAQEVLNFKTNGPSRIHELSLIDMRGIVVREIFNIDKFEFSLERNGFAAGIYFVRVTSENSDYTTARIIFE